VDDNPEIRVMDIAYVNDTSIIRQNQKVTAINSAIEIDLTGQVCADSMGTYQYSGIGGQMDFIHGDFAYRALFKGRRRGGDHAGPCSLDSDGIREGKLLREEPEAKGAGADRYCASGAPGMAGQSVLQAVQAFFDLGRMISLIG
jgi:hypothetical protein